MTNWWEGGKPDAVAPYTGGKLPGVDADGNGVVYPADGLGGVGPFTDGDGNVYSVEFNEDDAGLEIRCVKLDGTVLRVGVFDGVAGVRVDGPPGQTYLTITNGNVSFQLTDAGGNQLTFSSDPNPAVGAQIVVTNEDATTTATMLINQDAISFNGVGVPFKINGVAVDPTQPWPGA